MDGSAFRMGSDEGGLCCEARAPRSAISLRHDADHGDVVLSSPQTRDCVPILDVKRGSPATALGSPLWWTPIGFHTEVKPASKQVMKRSVIIGVLSLLLATTAARPDEASRLEGEASALFAVVMASEAPPARCQYRLDWSTESVPEYVAAKYLGLRLHADLSAPSHPTSLRDMLDPRKRTPAAFCNPSEMAAYETAQFEAFEKDRSAKQARVEHTDFSFPIFDADYRKAIIIISRSGIERDRLDMPRGTMKPGDIMRHPGDGGEWANVYAKTNLGWALIASKIIGMS